MFYVKLKENGSVDRYPYTLTDLRRENPGTSFAKQISDESAAGFNVFPVVPVDPPAEDHNINISRSAEKQGDKWVEKWISTAATAEEITERTTSKALSIRQERNQKLSECDWTQLADSPVDKQIWETYRQSLRDITTQPGFPWSISWPAQP